MKKSVIVIEDDRSNVRLYDALLKRMPHIEYLIYRTAEEGVKHIRHITPDAVILDIKLPKKSGIEICKELKQIPRFENVPFIAVTAQAMPGDKKRILDAGFSNYVKKPIKITEFRKLLRKILEIS
jgi:CheY-like chemotaxis protein